MRHETNSHKHIIIQNKVPLDSLSHSM